MVELSIQGEMLMVSVKGLHKLWAFKGSVEIPLRQIEAVRADPEGTTRPEGIRNPGTCIPGLISAGTFHNGLKRVFWDVCDSKKAIVISMKSGQYDVLTVLDHRYDELVVEVSDPDAAVRLIRANLS